MRAVILSGGKGTRLRPYTTVLPKPLMPIGDMPILEVVIRQLQQAGVTQITMAVGYLAELLRAFFGEGEKFKLSIDYSMEKEPMGTVGPLTLISGLDDTFVMMNGDVLTDLDYADLIAFHKKSGAVATIATYERKVKIDFGVIETDSAGLINAYIEKPEFDYRVSMGVYVFEPEVLAYLKPGEYLDFPDLVKILMADNKPVASYPFSGYWLDMGRPDDYERAIDEFESRRSDFLRGE
ncbi:MAG: NTP transferase domain-containing protein [Pseudomonadales bacterium]|nr:NTP transferase domain-containing protein [Hahellaceae bacterium]MCP5214437.1 NTP transferase domain-containing protein [Pseudomonadales bacterium]